MSVKEGGREAEGRGKGGWGWGVGESMRGEGMSVKEGGRDVEGRGWGWGCRWGVGVRGGVGGGGEYERRRNGAVLLQIPSRFTQRKENSAHLR